jgi:hypothetical protein
MSVNPRLGACLLWFMNSFWGGASDIHRPVLYAVYGSDIMVRLMRIHAHPERDGPDGWLVVALRGRKPAYVQCRFADHGALLLCEAVAGAYPPAPGTVPQAPSAETEEGLRKSGYWRDTGGHALFQYELTADSGVWGGASVVILNPLIDVFGARATSRIDIIAPLAPERDEMAIQRELRRR